MGTLTKLRITQSLRDTLGLSMVDANLLVDEFFEEIRTVLSSGHHVKLSGFGNFRLRDKVERPGRNPKTGQKVSIDARRVVKFKAGLTLKKKL